jgi:hypothetical protein
MRALLFRRTAFLATLVTGLGLTASAVHGLSGMDTSLKVAAATHEPKTATVGDRWGECDRYRDAPARRV